MDPHGKRWNTMEHVQPATGSTGLRVHDFRDRLGRLQHCLITDVFKYYKSLYCLFQIEIMSGPAVVRVRLCSVCRCDDHDKRTCDMHKINMRYMVILFFFLFFTFSDLLHKTSNPTTPFSNKSTPVGISIAY